jgi:uncharacterized protein (TIGR03435 family)
MQEVADMELLRQYVHRNSEEAFAALVTRHVNLVYSAALRNTGNAHAAEEITQAVFIILAKKADRLRTGTILSGWLYQTARLTSASFLRTEFRRARREQEAYMQSLSHEAETRVWSEIEPLLEDAMGRLGEKERNALVLRFFEGKSYQEIGTAVGATENAAKKRVSHGLEKLRKCFSKRGVVSTTAIIAGAISANSVQAAPVVLTKSVTAVAIAKGAAASGSTLILIKGALKLMAWAKAKMATLVGTIVILAVGTTTIILNESKSSQIDAYLTDPDLTEFRKAPPLVVVQPTHVAEMHGRAITFARDEDGKMVGRQVPLKMMMSKAYDFALPRIVFTTEVPTNAYDYLIIAADRTREKFQAEIKKVTGYVGRREIRTVDVLLLKANPSAATKLKASSERYYRFAESDRLNNWKTSVSFPTLPALVSQLESLFQKPVIDQTGITNHYGVILDWQANRVPIPEGYSFEKATLEHHESLKKPMLDQLGLELVPSREPIEMLVVEKVK